MAFAAALGALTAACGDDSGQAAPAAGSGGASAGASGTIASGSGTGGSAAGSVAAMAGRGAGSGAGTGAAGIAGGAAAGSAGRAAGAAGASGAPLGAAGTGSGGTGGSGLSGSGASINGSTLTAKIVAKNIAPEGQNHICVVVELPNQAPVWVNKVSASLSGGSHHLIVDRQPADEPLQTEPQVCAPTMASDVTRLIIAQQKETAVVLPSGVAFKLEARQKIFLQLHYFNVDSTAHDITGTVDMTIVDAAQGTPIEAKTLFTGATQISIPAHQMTEVKSFYQPRATTGTRRVFALTSHTHRLGIKSTIERVASMNAAATTPLHTSMNWSEPPLTQLDPPLMFAAGSDGLRLTCRYNNTTDQPVTFGVEAQDEMCFMWLYYYDQ